MIKLTEIQNGDLEITITDKEEFQELIGKINDAKFNCGNIDDYFLCEAMDIARYIGNDWYCCVTLGLTEVPNICQGSIHDDVEDNTGGSIVDYEKIWYYGNYMITSFVNELIEKGFTTFTRLR